VVKLMIVEDSDVYRHTLELLLAPETGIEIVGSWATARAAVDHAATAAPDVVLVDYRLPDLDGAEAIAALRGSLAAPAVLCLTGEIDDDVRARATAAGATEVLEKGRPIDDLVRAIRAATREGDA
jgi:DNA-binding NarL/FixJ family response regulator